MSAIKIFGHLVPDTDATVSAIAYAWYYNNVKKESAEAFVLGNLNKETLYLLNRFSYDTPPVLETLSANDTVVIVDTNNTDELPETLSHAEVIEIVDHHKLSGGITSTSPLSITMRPMASTSSLIYTIMNPELHPLPPELAGIMLGALLSDTLEFRSPTTTDEDKAIAEELAKISGVDMGELATEMFNAKSDISDQSPEDLIMMDSKIYETEGLKVRFSVLETTNPESVLDQKDAIIDGMVDHVSNNDTVDEVLLFVIDILNEEAYPITASDTGKDLIEKAFTITLADDTVLDSVVSRKKQIVPKFNVS